MLLYHMLSPVLCCAQAQAAVVTQICTVLESALYGQDSGQLLVSALQQELRFAETVDVWAVWPFPATPDSSRLPVLSWSQDLSEVLRIGLHTERLPTVLPLMTLLFEALPACSSKSEHLITTLDVLTELRHDMRVTEPCRKCIDNMLSMESLVGDVVANPPPTVGSNMRAYLKDHSLNRTDAFWQSALQPLVPSDPNEADTPAHTPNRVRISANSV